MARVASHTSPGNCKVILTLYFALFRHHFVLDHSVSSPDVRRLASVLQPTRCGGENQNHPKVRRRGSVGEKRFKRRSSQAQDSSGSDSNGAKWPEYTVRKSLVKFRTRRSAKRWSGRSRSFPRRSRAPSATINRVLDNVYDISRSEDARAGAKLVAVFYSWFFGSIIDLYYSLTDDGRERSLVKWMLASALVTATALLLAFLVAVGLYLFNFLLLRLLNAGLLFATVLVSAGICFLGVFAVYNYNWQFHAPDQWSWIAHVHFPDIHSIFHKNHIYHFSCTQIHNDF